MIGRVFRQNDLEIFAILAFWQSIDDPLQLRLVDEVHPERVFLEAQGPSVRAEFHHAVAFRITHLVSENAGAALERQRFPKEIEIPVENVVAEDERRTRTTQEICADQKRLRDSFRFRLGSIL